MMEHYNEARVISVGDPTHYAVNDDGSVSVLHESMAGTSAVPLPANWHDYPPSAWAFADGAFVENVDGERQRLWDGVKRQRTAILAKPCATPIGLVQTNAESLAAIDRLMTAALADPEHWSDVFTTADNQDEPVDHGAMKAVKAALVAREQAVRGAARDVRDALFDDDVTTLAQLFAIPTTLPG